MEHISGEWLFTSFDRVLRGLNRPVSLVDEKNMTNVALVVLAQDVENGAVSSSLMNPQVKIRIQPYNSIKPKVTPEHRLHVNQPTFPHVTD